MFFSEKKEIDMHTDKIFQVSTLQALSLGYTRAVTSVREFLRHGNTGLGTFEGVDGEMIVIDGQCYQANEHGAVIRAASETGIPFAVIADCGQGRKIEIGPCSSIDALKEGLDCAIDEAFELNSMHVVRINGLFEKIYARSESGMLTNHVELKDILKNRQLDFTFEHTEGSIIALHFPNYMDGINAAGWHLHYIDHERTRGGHVFNLSFEKAEVIINPISQIEILMPTGPMFDTYDMKSVSQEDIRTVEQGKK